MDICLYSDGALSHSSSIPIGAKHITNDIAVGLRVSLESAEKIKLYLSKHLSHSQEKTKKQLESIDLSSLKLPENLSDVSLKTIIDEIIGARIEEMYRMIGEEIEKSGFSDGVPSGLVISGGGALTVGMVEMGRKIVGLPIRVGVPSRVSGLLDEVIDPQHAAVVGLILSTGKNIMELESGMKKFNKIFKDFSVGGSMVKIKDLIKQFIP